MEVLSNNFEKAFGFDKKQGASSIFMGEEIEIVFCHAGCAHLAIETNSILRAAYHLENRGYIIDNSTAKKDADGNIKAVYFKSGAFNSVNVHLLAKK